jgi:hypothetical protein
VDLFGPGPFEVVGTVAKSDQAMPMGLILRTKAGEWEIGEVWLALADGPGKGSNGRGRLAVG